MLLIKIHFGLLYVAGETVMKTVNFLKYFFALILLFYFLFLLFFIIDHD